MSGATFESAVFINCPFDKLYEPLLEASIFCCVYLGFSPQLASLRLEAGEVRLGKIVTLIKNSKYSIHDLSRCKSQKDNEPFRMNMPFAFGIDYGLRNSGIKKYQQKKFLIFETIRFDLKSSLSDTAGHDVEYHGDDFQLIIEKIRNFFRVEAEVAAPGTKRIIAHYSTFQAWFLERKIAEGHSEDVSVNLPFQERIQEMQLWIRNGKPNPVAMK